MVKVIYGTEPYAVDKVVKEKEQEISSMNISFCEGLSKDVLTLCKTYPFLDTCRLVVVTVDTLTDEIKEYLDIPEFTTLFILPEKVSPQTKIFKELKNANILEEKNKLTENQIDQTTGNYTPCTDWKNNKKRKVYRFDGCKTGYEDVDGLCQEVKLECVLPKIESNGSCMCPSEYRTVRPANAKVKICVEDNGVKKYLFDGCEDEYELINDRCEKIKPVIPEETEDEFEKQDDQPEETEDESEKQDDQFEDDVTPVIPEEAEDEHEEPNNEGNDKAGEVICYNTCSDHNMNLASGHSNKSGYNTMLRSCATMEHDLPCHDPENIGCDNSYCTVECEAGTETNRCPEDRKSDAGTTKSSSSSTFGASLGGAGGSSGSMGVFPEPYKEDRVDKRLDVKMKHDVDDTGVFR